MAVTVVKRPTGHKIIDQAIEAMITDNSGDALISFPYHALETGDTVYITSDIDEYNGFWLVTVVDVNSFKISELEGGLGTLVFTPFVLVPLSSWGISNTSAEPMVWTGGAAPFLTVSTGVSIGGLSDFFNPPGVSFEAGRTYKYSFQFTYSHTVSKSLRIRIQVTDTFYVVLTEQINPLTATSTPQVFSGEFEFVCPSGATKLGVIVDYPTGTSESGLVELDAFDDLTEDVYEGGTDFVEYYQDSDIDYYQSQEHDWSSIFLPIVYKVSNDKWPTNSVDAVNLIVLNSDDNGFTSLTLAAPFSANALEFLTITGASTAEANGVWQIVDILTSNVVVINLPYELSGSLIGATVQYYYNNYQVKVKIFAGLNASHPWESKKPYEEVAELSLTPDENNLVMFSIADYIKMKVAIKNNLLLFSLPLNLDAFTGFYISTAESYDDSDNYSLTTNESYFITDDFEGYAIAGKLEFKNVYSGDYADFVYTSGSPARWLTNRSRLLAVEGYYFDVSFIKNIEGTFFIRFNWYVSDYLTLTEDVQISDQGIGVYRIPVTANANYDSVCILARTNDVPEHTDTVLTPFNLSEGVNYDLGAPGSYDRWTFGPIPEQDITGGNQVVPISWPFQVANGVSYTFQYTVVITTTNVDTEIRITLRDTTEAYSGSTFAGTGTKTHVGSGTFTDTITIVSSGTTPDVSLNVSVESLAYNVQLTAFGTTEEVLFPATPGVQITEEICIDILEACDVADGFISTEGRRLLEAGGYRLLE